VGHAPLWLPVIGSQSITSHLPCSWTTETGPDPSQWVNARGLRWGGGPVRLGPNHTNTHSWKASRVVRTGWSPRRLELTERGLCCSRQPWSAYAVHLTTVSPPALLGDMALVYLFDRATMQWDKDTRWVSMWMLIGWMLTTKFIKLLGHYLRYPADIFLLPVSILFGYFHGAIKMYAVLTLNVVSLPSAKLPVL
jgi:hypothetical protein